MSAIGLIVAGLAMCVYAIKPSKADGVSNTAQGQVRTVSASADLLAVQPQLLQGASYVKGGVRITPTSFKIVEQNGTGGQVNSPVNLGTYLEVKGPFTLKATVGEFKDSPASLYLYGQVPIIADEFRIERQAIHLIIADGKLTVEIWDGGRAPKSKQSFAFTSVTSLPLQLAFKDGKLTFLAADKVIGSVSVANVIKDKLWFGADAPSGNWLISAFTIEEGSGAEAKIVDASTRTATTHDAQGLQALAAKRRPDFKVGAAMSPYAVATDSQYAAVAMDSSQFGSWTPENAMKMQFLQPRENAFYFQQADLLVKIAQQNGITMHGHTLVFGEANPKWVNDLPVATPADKLRVQQVMENHITQVVSHFGTKVSSWDVVNEPMADYDDTADGEGATLRQHKWQKAMGEAYIAKAFVAAHKANPEAMLFVNDYGLESEGDRWDAFVQLMTRLKAELQRQNVPIDKIGVGFQAHVYTAEDRIDPAVLAAHIRQLASLGFKSQISEMDVYSDDGDDTQGLEYAAIFKVCLNEPSCIAWRTWILSDRYNYWKDEDDGQIFQGKDGLFGTDMQPRAGYLYIQRLLSQ